METFACGEGRKMGSAERSFLSNDVWDGCEEVRHRGQGGKNCIRQDKRIFWYLILQKFNRSQV